MNIGYGLFCRLVLILVMFNSILIEDELFLCLVDGVIMIIGFFIDFGFYVVIFFSGSYYVVIFFYFVFYMVLCFYFE